MSVNFLWIVCECLLIAVVCQRPKNYHYSTEEQKFHKNLAPVLVINVLGILWDFLGNWLPVLVFWFLPVLHPDASAPVVGKYQSPSLVVHCSCFSVNWLLILRNRNANCQKEVHVELPSMGHLTFLPPSTYQLTLVCYMTDGYAKVPWPRSQSLSLSRLSAATFLLIRVLLCPLIC